jgi:hypothetical protein
MLAKWVVSKAIFLDVQKTLMLRLNHLESSDKTKNVAPIDLASKSKKLERTK